MNRFSSLHPADIIADIANKAIDVYPTVSGRKATEEELHAYSVKQLKKLAALGATGTMSDDKSLRPVDTSASAPYQRDPLLDLGEGSHITQWESPRDHITRLTRELLITEKGETPENSPVASDVSEADDNEKDLYKDPELNAKVPNVLRQLQGMDLPKANTFPIGLGDQVRTSTPDLNQRRTLSPINEFDPLSYPAKKTAEEAVEPLLRQMEVMFDVLIGVQEAQKHHTVQLAALNKKVDNLHELCIKVPTAVTLIGGVRNEMIALRSAVIDHFHKIDKVVPDMSERILRRMAEITFKADPFVDGAFTAVKGPNHPSKRSFPEQSVPPAVPTAPAAVNYPPGLSVKPSTPGAPSTEPGYSFSEALNFITLVDKDKKYTRMLPKIARRLAAYPRAEAKKIMEEMEAKKTVILGSRQETPPPTDQ